MLPRTLVEADASCGRARTLRAKVDGKLFERTVDAGATAGETQEQLATLRSDGVTSPELAFRDPYVLDLLGPDTKYSEAELEQAILDEMQRRLSAIADEPGEE